MYKKYRLRKIPNREATYLKPHIIFVGARLETRLFITAVGSIPLGAQNKRYVFSMPLSIPLPIFTSSHNYPGKTLPYAI
jgi:hypothetical protein